MQKLYIANTSMISPVGDNLPLCYAAIKAGMSTYQRSAHYFSLNNEPLTEARVPDSLLEALDTDASITIDEGDRFNYRHDRIIKMTILALRQLCSDINHQQAIPLLLGLSPLPANTDGLCSLHQSLATNIAPIINESLIRSLYQGRASGLSAINMAFDYLYSHEAPYFIVAGSDNYFDDSLLNPLDQRLLSAGVKEGFAIGEASSGLLLTRHSELAQVVNGHCIALHRPGLAEEEGHMLGDAPYRGDGLATAFQQALSHSADNSVQAIYSSMNGEHYWAKEFGVAQIRNKQKFTEALHVEHPADCYGDIGAATAPVLIALATQNLLHDTQTQRHLVYASSDTALRGAIILEKCPATV